MPAGGKIAPDGRTPRHKGVGKNAKRHDLEAPATPGLHGSDLQQGDVQMLEQGQRVAPRAKKQQVSGSPQAPRQRQSVQRGSNEFSMAAPDPIQMAAGRMGGQVPTAGGGVPVDPTPWLPLIRTLASAPNSGGSIAANLVDILSQHRRRPIVTQGNLLDFDELDRALE